ncbi:MAG: hypothetical protein BWY31_01420 [Lentisphaerae bacterium ADurb.Bin242]|nr:MAG: hypothetical protein BWY31_01420 [Lentisphaerae bacterium ADurb.Bin242]
MKLSLSLGLFLCMCGAFCGENLVGNGDFSAVRENGIPEKWGVQSWGPPLGEVSVDRSDFINAPASLCIRNKDDVQQTFLSQGIRLEPNTSYCLSYYIKAENITGTKPFCGAMIYIMDSGNPLFSIGSSLYRHATGSFDWKKVEHKFKTKTLQGKSLSIILALRQASGCVRFDAVRLEKVEAPEKTATLKTELYPVEFQNRTYSLCRNFPAALLLRMTLDRKRIADGSLRMILELPEGIRYIGSGALLPARNTKNELVFERDAFTSAPVLRDGKKYTRYEITFAPGFVGKLGPSHAWENYDRIYLKAEGAPGDAGKVFWRLRSSSKEFPEEFFHVTILPELVMPPKPCSVFQLCIPRLWNMNSPENVSELYTKLWTSLQKRPWTSNPYYIHAFPEAEKKRVFDSYNYTQHVASSRSMPWFGPLYNAAAQNRFKGKLPPSVGADGKAIPNTVSPWYLIEDPENLIWGVLADEYAKTVRANPHTKAIALNYEPGTMSHCFSTESRTRFRDFAKLPAVPSVADILSKYKPEWLRFRIRQHQQILERISAMIRTRLPGVEFWLISDPLQTGRQRVSEWCGVDVQAADPIVDIHQDMPYITGVPFFEMMKLNISELKKPCFPLIDPSENMAMYYNRYTPEKVMQNIVATAALGGYGIGFWPADVFDGRYLHSIRDAYAAIAEVEPFYTGKGVTKPEVRFESKNVVKLDASDGGGNSTKISFPPLDRNIRVLGHWKGNDFLVTILNYNENSPAFLELAVPEVRSPYYQVEDVLGGRFFLSDGKAPGGKEVRDGFLAEVPSNGTLILRLTAGNSPSVPAGNAVDQKQIREKLGTLLSQYKTRSRMQPFREGNSAAYWEILKDCGRAVLYLEQDGGRLGIAALEGSEVISWESAGRGRPDSLFHKGRGFLGRFNLNSPEQSPDPCVFEIAEITRRDGNPCVVFQYRVPDFQNASAIQNPLKDLTIRQSITLYGNGKKFTLAYEFTNPTGKEMTFSFKVNNFPKIGSAFAGEKTINSITNIRCGSIAFTPGRPKTQRLFLVSKDVAPELRKHLLFGRLEAEIIQPGVIRVEGGEELKEVLTLEPKQDYDGLYSWSNLEEGYTVEPVSSMITLAPGKSVSWSCDYTLSRE